MLWVLWQEDLLVVVGVFVKTIFVFFHRRCSLCLALNKQCIYIMP